MTNCPECNEADRFYVSRDGWYVRFGCGACGIMGRYMHEPKKLASATEVPITVKEVKLYG